MRHELIVVGANHKSVHIWLREKFRRERDHMKAYEPTARLKEHAGNGDGETFDLIIGELLAIS